MQIYWGAVPFVIIQMVMVGLIIAFPSIVSSGLDKKLVIDLDKVKIDRPVEPNDATPRTDDDQMRGFDKVAPPAAPAGAAPLMPTPTEPATLRKGTFGCPCLFCN